jgi:uncharacterized protein
MPALTLLIKPASSLCQMQCRYCFYHDVAKSRENASFGLMSDQTLENVVRKALDYASTSCSFAFQGGEPTLAGLDFYRKLIVYQEKYNKSQIKIQNSIQTNGMALDQDWASFLHKHHFLVGLSLDGPAEIHNLNRLDSHGNGTYNAAMASAELLAKYQVDFNILSVMTRRSSRSAEKIYRFFTKHDFRYLQFIPYLDSINGHQGISEFSMTPNQYGEFLCRIFDLWQYDILNGSYISIRFFDNLVRMIQGCNPEACDMIGHCSINLVIEGNGNAYPCDFYCQDQWLLGNMANESMLDLLLSQKAKQFADESRRVPSQCRKCPYLSLCRNACRRYREPDENQEYRFYYCPSYRQFFDHALPRLRQIASMTH